jgi:hypothetical protein
VRKTDFDCVGNEKGDVLDVSANRLSSIFSAEERISFKISSGILCAMKGMSHLSHGILLYTGVTKVLSAFVNFGPRSLQFPL